MPRALPLLALLACAAADGPQGLADRARESESERLVHIGNECHGQAYGPRCHGRGVLECSQGTTLSFAVCKAHEECERGACREAACARKDDGLWCHGGRVVECRAGKTEGARECGAHEECEVDQESTPSVASCQDICRRKGSGSYCEDGRAVACSENQVVKVSTCAFSQECKSISGSGLARAACEEKDCAGHASGTYCMHGGVVECRDLRGASLSKCPFYQECSEHSGSHGTARCVEKACDNKLDGWRCHGKHRVRCADSLTVDFEVCSNFTECGLFEGMVEPVCSLDGGGARALDMDAMQLPPGSFALWAAPSVGLAVAMLASALSA